MAGHNHRVANNRALRLAGVYALVICCTIIGVKLLVGDYPPPENEHRINTRNTVYILLSQPRSGSSWVGSFFDAHEDVFFVYEPFHPKAYENSDQHLSTEVMQTEILKSLCTCSFTTIAPAHGLHHKSKALDRAKGIIKSMPPDPEKMSSECKASRYTVAKILQLADPQIISTVSRLAQCDIHIAHLIRDPRPSILSRMTTFKRFFSDQDEITEFTELMVQDSADLICREMMSRVEGLSSLPFYNSFKFEELKQNPVSGAKALFAGLEIPWTEGVESHVEQSSQGSSHGGGFGIVKDSANVGREWREDLPKEFRAAIELSCKDMMEYFKYRTLTGHDNDETKRRKRFEEEDWD